MGKHEGDLGCMGIMTITEKFEVSVILVLGVSVFFMASPLATEVSIGRLLLYTSALLLLQSLVRDLWILASNRNVDKSQSPRKARCMCIESTVGFVGVLIGALLLGSKIDQSIAMAAWTWTVLVVIVLGAGFCIKDFVFEWNPWRIYRDKDHMNIIFTWKK